MPSTCSFYFLASPKQVSTWLGQSVKSFDALPERACPHDEVVAVITLHPRYLSKSDFPTDLFSEIGVKVVGGQSRVVRPKSWGIERHPDEVPTDDLFVAGTRQAFRAWVRALPHWEEKTPGAISLTRLEHIAPFSRKIKLKLFPAKARSPWKSYYTVRTLHLSSTISKVMFTNLMPLQ
jgi:hypothetical protein